MSDFEEDEEMLRLNLEYYKDEPLFDKVQKNMNEIRKRIGNPKRLYGKNQILRRKIREMKKKIKVLENTKLEIESEILLRIQEKKLEEMKPKK